MFTLGEDERYVLRTYVRETSRRHLACCALHRTSRDHVNSRERCLFWHMSKSTTLHTCIQPLCAVPWMREDFGVAQHCYNERRYGIQWEDVTQAFMVLVSSDTKKLDLLDSLQGLLHSSPELRHLLHAACQISMKKKRKCSES